jgi:mannose-6-phosphate isomerase-like protein (cupin superfamily)
MSVELYAPYGHDPQQPHAQDELYVVQHGTGIFRRGEEAVPFGPGDVLFVPARMPHRFETFSEDFATWVIFWGPPGGEAG